MIQTMIAHRQHPNQLTLRAIAVLVALRRGPLTTLQICNAISDATVADTHALLVDMITDTIDHRAGDGALWYLTHNGLGALEINGLRADPAACLWTVESERVRSQR
jgi:hypothetical protein